MNKEIRSLTGIRGLAALLVVAHHVAADRSIIFDNGYLGVDLFFVLSGFILCAAYSSAFVGNRSLQAYAMFWWCRICRIMPAYLFWLMLTLTLLPWLDVSGQDLFANAILIQNWGISPSYVGPAWSLSVEWLMYVVFPAALLLSAATWSRTFGMAVSVCIILFCATYHHDWITGGEGSRIAGPLDLIQHDGMGAVLRGGAEFFLGISGYRIIKCPRSPGFVKIVQYLSAMLACISLAFPNGDVVFVLATTLLIPTLYQETTIFSRALSFAPVHFLGMISFSLYICQTFMLTVLQISIPGAFAERSVGTNLLVGLACISALLLVSWASYRYIESPARSILRPLFAPRARSSSI